MQGRDLSDQNIKLEDYQDASLKQGSDSQGWKNYEKATGWKSRLETQEKGTFHQVGEPKTITVDEEIGETKTKKSENIREQK